MDSLVVKVGGSLLHSVPELVQVIRAFSRERILVVPGGGPFAEQVRALSLPDHESHWMAIAAMEQYGWYIAAQGLDVTDTLQLPGSPHVLLPYRCLRERDPLPHTWDITSDTIAAWVAYTLHADLLLLKSVDGLSKEGKLLPLVSEVLPGHEIDAAFLPYVFEHRVACTILNGTRPDRLKAFLLGNPVRCTRLVTTF